MRNGWGGVARWSVFLTAISVLVLFAACAKRDPDVQAFQSDPMAKATFRQATLVRSDASGSGETFGKPSEATLVRAFRPDDGTDPYVVLADVVAASKANGWAVQDRDPPNSYIGHKSDERGPIRLTMYFARETGEIVLQFSRR